MTQLPILVSAANLTKSPYNVRTVSDAVADAQLEANIAVKGVRKNLIGVPVSRKKGHYRIIAGGRRLDAVHRLIEKGTLDADYQVAVLVLPNAKEAIETSLEENFFTLTMNPADTCRAFQDIIETEGKTPEDAQIRVVPTTHVSYNDTWDLQPLKGETAPLTPEQESRLAAIEEELDAINAAYEDGDEQEQQEQASRAELLEAEASAIANPTPILSDEQKAGALAYLIIGHDGQPRLHQQLYVAPVEDNAPEDQDDDEEEGGAANATGDVEGGAGRPIYSQRLSQELAEMKSELVRVHIASDPSFAVDLGIFWMVDKATRHYGFDELATELKADKPWSPLTGYKSDTPAAQEWSRMEGSLDRSWMDAGDACKRYDAFCRLHDDARAGWLPHWHLSWRGE
jgi:hypothetical protein